MLARFHVYVEARGGEERLCRGDGDEGDLLYIKDPAPGGQLGDDAAEDGTQDERHGERAADHGADEARLVDGAVFCEGDLREAVEARAADSLERTAHDAGGFVNDERGKGGSRGAVGTYSWSMVFALAHPREKQRKTSHETRRTSRRP